MSVFARLLTRIRDETVVIDKEEFAAGFREGREGGKANAEALLAWRIGWLVGRCGRLEEELEAARAESVDRILAAIEDVRGQADKRRKLDEQHMLDLVKHWRERALGAEWLLQELGHTVVPRPLKYTEHPN